jgi:hypothetical protein
VLRKALEDNRLQDKSVLQNVCTIHRQGGVTGS